MKDEKAMPLSVAMQFPKDACYVVMPPQATLAEAVTVMVRQGKSAIAVMQADGLAGLVTRTDVMATLAGPGGRPVELLPLSAIMTTALETAGPDESFQYALACMARSRIEHLPVVQDGRLVTVLYESELLRHQLEACNDDIAHLQEYIEGLHNARHD